MKLLGNLDELKTSIVVSRWEVLEGVGFTTLNKDGNELPISLFAGTGSKSSLEDLIKLVYNNAEKIIQFEYGAIGIYFKLSADKYIFQEYHKDAGEDLVAYNFLLSVIQEIVANGGYLMRNKHEIYTNII